MDYQKGKTLKINEIKEEENNNNIINIYIAQKKNSFNGESKINSKENKNLKLNNNKTQDKKEGKNKCWFCCGSDSVDVLE